MTLALAAYRYATTALAPLAGPLLEARARAGKEDGARLGERLGRAGLPRPEGSLLWLHGASVGESRVLLALAAALRAQRPDLALLFTSGTRTSAQALAGRLPERAQHQFAPVDSPLAVRRFLAHWRPAVGVFAESELWPNLALGAAQAGVRLALVNARLSPKSLEGWGRWAGAARRVFGAFEVVLAADARTAEGIGALLGRTVAALGNLKLAAPPPVVDAALAAMLRATNRPLWVAASTHPGEDEIALAAHARLRAAEARALLVIAPRHPERGDAIAALATGAPRRSQGFAPSPDHPAYVLDTIGELAAAYAAAPVALVGGSLLPHLKGHNPAEPLQLGCAALSGPHVESFADVFAALAEAGAVRYAASPEAIAAAVMNAWREEPARAAAVAQGRSVIARSATAMAQTAEAVLALAPQPAAAR